MLNFVEEKSVLYCKKYSDIVKSKGPKKILYFLELESGSHYVQKKSKAVIKLNYSPIDQKLPNKLIMQDIKLTIFTY